MAHLWIRDSSKTWTSTPLDDEPRTGAVDLARLLAPSEASLAPARAVMLLRCQDRARATWALVAGSGADVRVNGLRLTHGLRMLADRDEIRLTGATAYFCTERLACVAPIPAGDRRLVCPRCQRELDPGSPGVQCPGCECWYDQSNERPCFTYATSCTVCAHPTALGGDDRWNPAGL